ncbi:MAG: autotransporter-associated beta strand repeat-containing protein [Verrucomicrobiales bacterium]|nr:autotransporter-associated beta strand repeat-containing protein [Verrucomicrobiales bacterium]
MNGKGFSERLVVVVCLLSAPVRAAEYHWDNGAGNGLWNDPLNWSANIAPTASDGAWFRQNVSPSGTVRFSADGFAQHIRHDFSRAYRTFTIDSGQVVDRTLTLSGSGYALIDLTNHTVDVTFSGAPNANGARLKLHINGSGSSVGTRVNKAVTLRISCDVSGPGGFRLTAGEDGAGRLLLSGNNTYSGPTIAQSGVLLINGTNGPASAVTVNSGGILAGTGTVGGPVTVNPGGIVSPGINSQAPQLGVLRVNNSLTLLGDLMIDVNKLQSPTNDQIFVTGTLSNAGTGFVHVFNHGPVLAAGDRLQIFNQPLLNGQSLKVLSAGREVWTNKLAVDGSIEVLAATNAPMTGNPTRLLTWKGAVTSGGAWRVPMSLAANWVEGQAPAPGSSNIFLFEGDILVPYQWPYIDTNLGTTILIFSNNIALNSIKILAGSNNTVRLGSFVRQDTAQPCYYGITGTVPIRGADGNWYDVTCAYFTNELGDASCGSQTEFQCTGGRLDVYGVLRDGAGTRSRLVKSGPYTLNLTGNPEFGNDANTYTGGTIVNAGPIKMAKKPGQACIPGDVVVNGTGSLVMNVAGGEQIGDAAIVTLNDFGRLELAGQPETVQTVQGPSAGASVLLGTGGTLIVAPSATNTYTGGMGVSEFAGSISGSSGTVRKNGSGTWALLGNNAIGTLEVNAGALRLNGNSGTGPVTVQSGATLLAAGTVAGPVTVAAGGTLEAGLSVGTLTLPAGLNLSAGGAGATNVWELGALKDDADGVAGTDFDRIVVSGGTLALGPQATLEIRFTGSATPPDPNHPFWQARRAWRVIALSGGTNPGGSNFGRIRNGTWPAGTFTASADAGGILLSFTPSVTRPRITGLSGAGSGNVTVHYTNTLPGVTYVLSCNTNLAEPDWFAIGAKTATGTGDSQTDHAAGTEQRFYRVHHVSP